MISNSPIVLLMFLLISFRIFLNFRLYLLKQFFVTYRWDSSTSPAILGEFAELVGGFDDIHYCFGDYPAGSPSWSIWHYVVKLTIGNETQNYAVCPMGSTGDIEEIKMIDFSDLSNMRKFG